jgi:hypothetical protein
VVCQCKVRQFAIAACFPVLKRPHDCLNVVLLLGGTSQYPQPSNTCALCVGVLLCAAAAPCRYTEVEMMVGDNQYKAEGYGLQVRHEWWRWWIHSVGGVLWVQLCVLQHP